MIKVVYRRKRNKLNIDGHAYSGEPGHDLVCASASILAYTLAAAVKNLVGAGQVKEPIIELDAGRAKIACKPPPANKSVVTLMFDTVCGGFELLAANYPENISYEIRE